MFSDSQPQTPREKTRGPEALSKRSWSTEPFVECGVRSGQDRVLGQVGLNPGLGDPQPPRLVSAERRLRGKKTGGIWKQGTCQSLKEVKVEKGKYGKAVELGFDCERLAQGTYG